MSNRAKYNDASGIIGYKIQQPGPLYCSVSRVGDLCILTKSFPYNNQISY